MGYLIVAALVALPIYGWALNELEARDREIRRLRDGLGEEAVTRRRLTVERDRLAAEIETLRASPEQSYQLAVTREREARYRDAERAYEEMAHLYPDHALAARARQSAVRMRELQLQRNLTHLLVSVSGVETGWVATAGVEGRSVLRPEVSFRLRNVGGESLERAHLRVDFAWEPDGTPAGEALERVASLPPQAAREFRLRGLQGVEGADPRDLPAVTAHVWMRTDAEGFLRLGSWPVGTRVIGGP